MGNKVTDRGGQTITANPGDTSEIRNWATSLYTGAGRRKYLNAEERARFFSSINQLTREHALFALTLAWTGARPSELVQAVRPASFQIEPGILAIKTLKRRRHAVREIPLPPDLMRDLDTHFGLSAAQRDPAAAFEPLWPFCRQTAWRIIKRTMKVASIVGAAACPRGLRHSFGVGTLQSGIPINMTRKWLGHARLTTTTIYTDCSGPEDVALAARFWRGRDLGNTPRSVGKFNYERPEGLQRGCPDRLTLPDADLPLEIIVDSRHPWSDTRKAQVGGATPTGGSSLMTARCQRGLPRQRLFTRRWQPYGQLRAANAHPNSKCDTLSAAPIEILFGGATIRVSTGSDRATLQMVLQALTAAA